MRGKHCAYFRVDLTIIVCVYANAVRVLEAWSFDVMLAANHQQAISPHSQTDTDFLTHYIFLKMHCYSHVGKDKLWTHPMYVKAFVKIFACALL